MSYICASCSRPTDKYFDKETRQVICSYCDAALMEFISNSLSKIDKKVDTEIHNSGLTIEFIGDSDKEVNDAIEIFYRELGLAECQFKVYDDEFIIGFSTVYGEPIDIEYKDGSTFYIQEVIVDMHKISTLSDPKIIPLKFDNFGKCGSCERKISANNFEPDDSLCIKCQDKLRIYTKPARKYLQKKYKREYDIVYFYGIWSHFNIAGDNTGEAVKFAKEFFELLGLDNGKTKVHGEYVVSGEMGEVKIRNDGGDNMIVYIEFIKRKQDLRLLCAKKCAELGNIDGLTDDAIDQVLEFNNLLAVRYLF
ncbi:hypothetical protein F-VV57_0226 [Faustovirus]|nr:hypothetical protein F-VV57_0226 [Faustovirus]QJX73494.1 hypothetical protein F-VV63_0228 [Faustovirus]